MIPLNKRDEQFVARHREDLRIIGSKRFSDEDRKKALLKRGGAGFLGGVIIRHLLKWDETKKKKRNPLAGRAPRGRPRRAQSVIDEDSPVVPRERRRIPPIIEDDEDSPLVQSTQAK